MTSTLYSQFIAHSNEVRRYLPKIAEVKYSNKIMMVPDFKGLSTQDDYLMIEKAQMKEIIHNRDTTIEVEVHLVTEMRNRSSNIETG